MAVYDLAVKKKPLKRPLNPTKSQPPPSSSSESNPTSDGVKVEFSEPSKWVERMTLTSTRVLPTDLHADDDPKREEAFIQQTLLSVTRGINLLEEAGVVWKRPEDYYAEMYKDDVHMNHIRQSIAATRARVEQQSQRRAMKDQKKYGKEVQAEVLRQRAKHKRDLEDRLSQWKKKRRGGESLKDILDEDNEESGPSRSFKGSKGPKQRNLRPGGGFQKKRPGKNARSRRS